MVDGALLEIAQLRRDVAKPEVQLSQKCGRAPPEPPELRQKLGRAAQTQATQEAAGGPRRLTPCQQQPALKASDIA